MLVTKEVDKDTRLVGKKKCFGAGKLKEALKHYSYNLGIAIHNQALKSL